MKHSITMPRRQMVEGERAKAPSQRLGRVWQYTVPVIIAALFLSPFLLIVVVGVNLAAWTIIAIERLGTRMTAREEARGFARQQAREELREPAKEETDEHRAIQLVRKERPGEELANRAEHWEDPNRPHVVIIGAGFGGLYAAKALAKAPVRVTVLDRRNHHLFQPLLYQVATAGLSPADIAYPIRSVLRKQQNVRVLMQEARDIDVANHCVRFDSRALHYDYLIVATGASHSYFGHDEWAPYAPGLKSVEDAVEIRRRILCAFEAAELETDPGKRAACLTFVIVGGGPTGVELAGAIAEIARHTVARDFRAVDPTDSRVLLIEGTDRILPPYPERLSEDAQRQLEKLGVEVITGRMVSKISEDAVWLGDECIETRTTLWAAGVAASPLGTSLRAPQDRVGRVLVQPDLTIPGHPEVFVIGDLAAIPFEGKMVPGVAPAAMQEGRFAAQMIRSDLTGKDARRDFHYNDKGSIATIGRAAAVADLGRIQMCGLSAWVVWWAVHIVYLIEFRNRLIVMFGWMWSYLSFKRAARLITGSWKEPS